MPYSMDPNENRENPASPSRMLLSDQVIYRLASLEATLRGSVQSISDKIDSMQRDMHERHTDMKREVGVLDGRLKLLEKWQNQMVARISLIGGGVVFLWTFAAPYVRHFFGTVQ